MCVVSLIIKSPLNQINLFPTLLLYTINSIQEIRGNAYLHVVVVSWSMLSAR